MESVPPCKILFYIINYRENCPAKVEKYLILEMIWNENSGRMKETSNGNLLKLRPSASASDFFFFVTIFIARYVTVFRSVDVFFFFVNEILHLTGFAFNEISVYWKKILYTITN